MNKNVMYYALSVAVIIIIGACFAVFAKEDNYIVSFLNGYGYEVSEKPIERAEIRIPSPLDEVYEGYNKIQKKAGFDLKQYEGKNGIRYTYEVKNYPGNIEGVRANVIVIGGEIVGGDICTLSMDGFMHEFGGE